MANFKTIREEAVSVLKHIAVELLAVASAQEPVEGRQSVAIASVSIPLAQVWLHITLRGTRKLIVSFQIEADFVNGVSKKIVDSRKKVVEGISKGISKIVSTYA